MKREPSQDRACCKQKERCIVWRKMEAVNKIFLEDFTIFTLETFGKNQGKKKIAIAQQICGQLHFSSLRPLSSYLEELSYKG